MNISKLGIQKIFIEVTTYCNFRCDFCPITCSTRKPQHLDFRLLTKVVDEIARNKITDSIAFYILGEPLIYPHIFEAVHFARKNGLRTQITTNGSLLTADRVQRLVDVGLNKLTISLQRFGETDHQARRAPIKFDQYYQRILKAVSLFNTSDSQTEVAVMFMNNATKRFLDIDIPMRMSWNRNGFEKDLMTLIQDVYDAVGVEVRPSCEQVNAAVRKLSSSRAFLYRINDRTLIAIKPFLDWGNAFTSKKVYPSKFGFCGLAFSSLGILSNGEVTVCCVDYDGETSLGNIGDHSLTELLLLDKAQSIYRGLRRMRLVCPRCQICFGSTNPIKTLFRALLLSGVFKIVKPGPGKSLKEIYPLME